MSRGRGFSGRGSSFRGRGSDGGSWSNDSGSRGRGGFSGPSRGRGFNWYKDHSSGFDSRSRYPSGVNSSSGERYTSRGRGEDAGYRRYSRMDGPGYSTREHSHHRSPESQRKRMRTEHGYVQASSSRRSHEGSYGGGSDYGNRYGYSEEKGGYADERGRSYREERRSASGFRDRSREDYAHRKAEQLDSSMPPPSSAPTRHLSSPRGSFRGRISRGSRGMSRMIFPRRDTILIRKKSLMDSSYSFRKRMIAARSQAESLRRLKLQKLRRLKEAALAKKEGSDKEGAKGTEDISDDDEKEENWDDEEVEKAPGVDDDDDEDEEEEELEEGETPDKKEKKKPKEKKKEPKAADKDEEREEGEEVDDDEEEEEEDEDDDGSVSGTKSKKSDVKSDGGVHVTIKQDSDARAVSEEGRSRRIPRSTISGRPYIRLTCPHCYIRCITFKEYTLHLYTSKHINMMRKQSLRHKQTLARMRMNQRQKQRIVEESEEVHGSLTTRSNFCPICKLNYRQLKSKHQASECHRAMKKFLMPYCRVCRIGFKSPMLYENHICSIEHLKRKARLEERMMRLHDRDRDNDEGSGLDEDKELNMDNFMILDSVGTVDDTGDEEEGEEGKSKSDKEKKEGEEKKKEINLGAEYVKKVEVQFCELCRLYLPRLDQPERALQIHCRTRTHLQRYVRYRDDRALRSKAEKIHHRKEKENAAKEAEAKKKSEIKVEGDEKKDDEATSEKEAAGKGSSGTDAEASKKNDMESKTSQQNSGHNASGEGGADGDGEMDQDLESGMDDKLWADVDKDLGELLREVEPGNKSSDEDDDSRAEGGRYDRFRYSEKGNAAVADPSSEGDSVKNAAEAEETGTKSDAAGKGLKEAENAKSPDDKQTVNDTSSTVPVAVESS